MPVATNFLSFITLKKTPPSTVELHPVPTPSLRYQLSLLPYYFSLSWSSIIHIARRLLFLVPSLTAVLPPVDQRALAVPTVLVRKSADACPSPTSIPPSPSYQLPPIDIHEAFREFIQNDMPARLIDTSTLKFVERDDIFDLFSSEIAKISDEDIMERMSRVMVDMNPETANYVAQAHLKAALRETIRDVLRYAIFSHRWTNSEPVYQDLVYSEEPNLLEQRNHKTTGIVKLVYLCRAACSLGYKLVWSDTCCINKANAAELNEAVQAMFKWYANAHLCIVYLGASSSLSDFGRDPWFKRGWTLQELLAPRRIKFYDRTWCPLTALANDKNDESLMTALSRITGIPWEVIVADNSEGVKGHGIWQIMSWASTRKTTRTEDAAYCLVGLFDVNIHIVYGEGENAFTRLLEAIMAKYPSWDVFAWAGQASKNHPALPSSPECYPRWDEEMASGEGMNKFSLTPYGLHLTSVPLISVEFLAEVKNRDGTYTATLRPRSEGMRVSGRYSDVDVICGQGRLAQIRTSTDLQICILNYKPSVRNRDRGEMHVGRKYIAFLLYKESLSAEGSTWLKFTTDNVLRICCTGIPERTSVDGIFDEKEGVFDLRLKTTRIRGPRQTMYFEQAIM